MFSLKMITSPMRSGFGIKLPFSERAYDRYSVGSGGWSATHNVQKFN